MTATAHALVAGAIASKFSDPATAAAFAFTSHFIMDSVPHWDIGTNWRLRSKETTGLFAILETLLGITIAYGVFGGKVATVPLTVAILASLVPDWLETPWYIFFAKQGGNGPKKHAGMWENLAYGVYKMENALHAKAQFPLGLITQVVTVAFFLFLLK